MSSHGGQPFLTAYAASKGAIETFTTGFAKEVARDGIRVNCIRPGHIYTEMHASGGEPGPARASWAALASAWPRSASWPESGASRVMVLKV